MISDDSTTPEKYLGDSDVEYLIADGIPEEVARYIQDHRGFSKKSYAFSVFLFIVAMILIMMVCAFAPLSPPFQQLLHSTGWVAPEALMVKYQPVASVFGVFLGIITTGVLFCLVTMKPRGLAIRSTVTQIQQCMTTGQNVGLNLAMLRAIHRKIDPTDRHSVEDFLAAFPHACLRFYLKIFVPVLLVTATFVCFDIGAVSYATADQFVVGKYFTFSRKTYSLHDVTEVSTGCNPRGDEPSLRYNLHFSDGRILDIEEFKPISPEMKELDLLSEFDAVLRERGIPRSRALFDSGLYKGKSVYDEACLKEYSRKIPKADREQFFHLYRVPD